MVRIIYGSKGSGKTKRIIDSANVGVDYVKGECVYITDNSTHTLSIDRRIRFVNIKEHVPCGEQWFIGFLKGMVAANSDITDVFIDGINRFLTPPTLMEAIFNEIERITEVNSIDFTLTISTDELPEFMKKYL